MKSSRVLLINPRSWNEPPPSYVPYGILWIASYLKKAGHSVIILDRNVDKKDIKDVIFRFEPQWVGITCLTGPVIKDAILCAKEARPSRARIVWGGIHPTLFSEDVLRSGYADYVIRGEGEITLAELIDQGIPVPGISFLRKNKYMETHDRPIIEDLDVMPLPSFELLDMDRYIMHKWYSDRVISINTSRGCPHRCAFCYNQNFNKRKWRGIGPEKIIEMIERLKYKYGIHGFQIYDDEFDVDKNRVIRFAQMVIEKKLNIKFTHFSRVTAADEKMYFIEQKAGLVQVDFGVESGSQRVLDFVQKDQTVGQIKKAFSICGDLKLKVGACFMIGFPTETQDDLNKTVRLMRSLKTQYAIPSIFKPYPGTQLYEFCLSNSLINKPGPFETQGDHFSYGDIGIAVGNKDILKRIFFEFKIRNIMKDIIDIILRLDWKMFMFRIKTKLRRKSETV